MRLLIFFIVLPIFTYGQHSYSFEPSALHPFGLPNPDAPKEILDWSELIGECDCHSISRNPDQSWGDTVKMTWRFKYIMNGWAVQDETLKEDGKYAGSIRQYNSDSSHWYVHYYSSAGAAPNLPSWEGNRLDSGRIVLYREQKAPNGLDGYYKITFSDISTQGFNWLGEWMTPDESFSFPTWKIYCKKKKNHNTASDRREILKNIESFSSAYMNADYETMAKAYSSDGMILPSGSKIISGYENIKNRWVIKNGSKIVLHKVTPTEIKIIASDYAYDYGYYEGKTRAQDGTISDWRGKYVIIWKREDGNWKMFLDIWNRVNQ